MQRRERSLVFSPSDLTEFMESPYASWMSRFALDHREVKPAADPEAALFQQHGILHEERVLARMQEDLGLDVAVIPQDAAHEDAERLSLEAIRAGRDVVYQARLVLPPFGGIADFLVHPRVAALVTGESDIPLGTAKNNGIVDHASYEVWDAKLSHSAKASHLVQLCAYVEMLEAVDGARAEQLVVALGSGQYFRSRVADSFHYYRAVKRAFLAAMEAYDENECPLPDAGRKHGRWDVAAKAELERRDHTSRVAGLNRSQSQKLAKVGIETLTALADSPLDGVPGIAGGVFSRLREQAQLQRDTLPGERPRYRVIPPDHVQPHRGLWNLPASSDGDIFFDIEGDPLAEGGLEYLWGVAYREQDGRPAYRAFWAHDPKQEQAAFEDFVDWVCDRRSQFPDLHVYHYAPYELTAIKRLMGRTGSREVEINELLIGRVFVDLYQVVRHSIRMGAAGYGLKDIEKVYRGGRETEVTGGLGSIVEYEAWRNGDEGEDPERSPMLESIRAYNEDDCVSTLELEQWLRARQCEEGFAYDPPPASEEDEKTIQDRRDRAEEQRRLVEELTRGLGDEPASEGLQHDRWRVQKLLADLVGFYSREAKPIWWEKFDRADMTENERYEQSECLAGVQRTDRERYKRKGTSSYCYEYHFDPNQDTRIDTEADCWVAQDIRLKVIVEEIDLAAGRIVLKVSNKRLEALNLACLPDRLCLIRDTYIRPGTLETALADTARKWLEDDGLPTALRDLLFRMAPRIRGHASGALRGADEALNKALERMTSNLEDSALCVQGPPGSGKTTMAAEAICSLAASGKVIAILSNSHKAIGNLMHACGEESRRRGIELHLVKAGSKPEHLVIEGEPGVWGCKTKEVLGLLQPGAIAGATAWCFSRPELEQQFDYLFVDEAGQVSLANLVAVSRCARNLVLLGDPAQLGQPLRGVHPGESGQSALDYVTPPGRTVLADDRALFFDKTYRLHPELCEFISEAFYEGRLESAEANERRILLTSTPTASDEFPDVSRRGAGLVFVPVKHLGNRQSSEEEVEVIARLVEHLIGRGFRQDTESGVSDRPLTEQDILIVAPYNLQVGLLGQRLPNAIVGTVDKFQGQQAPVVIFSLCASEAGLAPRGIDFLLSPNRLNVALSRAQCMAIVVGNPDVANARCSKVGELTLVNRICRVMQ